MQAPDERKMVFIGLVKSKPMKPFSIHQWHTVCIVRCETISHSSDRLNSLNAIALALANDHSAQVKCSLTDFACLSMRPAETQTWHNSKHQCTHCLFIRKWLATESNKSKLSYMNNIFINNKPKRKTRNHFAYQSATKKNPREMKITKRCGQQRRW